jgi:hypothetical protein
MGKRILRYHKQVLLPSWFDDAFEEYKSCVYKTGPLAFSAHSVYKLVDYISEYGRAFLRKLEEILVAGAIQKELAFEFYADKDNIVQKMCFRYTLENSPVDIILVIARDCTIITIYTTEVGNMHDSINKKAYVRKEK